MRRKDYIRSLLDIILLSLSFLLIIYGLFLKQEFFWQLGVIILITEIFIGRFKARLLYGEIKKAMRYIMGIEDPTSYLFPELMNLIRENQYHVVERKIIDKTFYSTKSKNEHFNMYSTSEEAVLVTPREDNIYYAFERGSGEVNKPVEVKKIICEEILSEKDEKGITEEFDPYNSEEVSIISEARDNFYVVCKPLKKGRIYRFKIKTTYPPCMSDLKIPPKDKNIDGRKDWLDYIFRIPTQKLYIDLYFPFKIKDYEFHIKRANFSRTKFKILDKTQPEILSFDYKKNKISIYQENFDKGDTLRIEYYKKF